MTQAGRRYLLDEKENRKGSSSMSMKLALPLGAALSAVALFAAASCSSESSVSKKTPRFEKPGLLEDFKFDRSKADFFVSPQGDDSNDGRSLEKAFKTMQKGVDCLSPGQALLVLKGLYKEGFRIKGEGRPDAWKTVVAEPGVEIRGSDRETNWKLEDATKGVYSIPRPSLIDHCQRPEVDLVQRCEMVFVDGELLSHVSQREMLKPKNVVYVDDNAKKLYVCLKNGADPNKLNVEVARRTWAIQVGAPPNMNWWADPKIGEDSKTSYVRINGFKVRNVADFSRQAAIQVRGLCHDVIVENCDVQWAAFCGIAVSSDIWRKNGQWLQSRVDDAIVRHCVASNCGVQGIGGGGGDGARNLLIESNVMDGNNYKNMSPWNEGGACKTGFEGVNIVVRNNVARNNNNHGLWFDYGGEGGVFENNLVVNSVAGGILDEVTPSPGLPERRPDGQASAGQDGCLSIDDPNAVRAKVTKGTVIRNNVIVGTRTPGGGGINLSSARDSQVYNNILYKNEGGGVNVGGSPTRPYTAGMCRNKFWSNICDLNFQNASLNRDESDKSGRTFGNVIERNLFLRSRGAFPYIVDGAPAAAAAFNEANHGAFNVVSDKTVFSDPDRLDFRLSDPGLAKSAGFDPESIRLDWSEFFQPEVKAAGRETSRRDFEYFTIDMSKEFNRALVDETAGDGKGGWTDQGPNDLGGIPNGKQVFDGVEYEIGPKELGALMLSNTPNVKSGKPFPVSAEIPVGKAFDSLFFLYTAAWTAPEKGPDGRISARPLAVEFTVAYESGEKEIIPVVYERHFLDWWTDPTWQQHSLMNDNGVYVGWQGPNGLCAKVMVYALRWDSPAPGKRIKSIEVSNRNANVKCAFALLAVTGANAKKGVAGKGNGPAFSASLNGDLDAAGSGGEEIAPSTERSKAAIAGNFEAGRDGRKAYRPKNVLKYPVPADFPVDGEGEISLWLKADDWMAPERVSAYRSRPYARVMTPLSVDSSNLRWSPWEISFNVPETDDSRLLLTVRISGATIDRIDVSDSVKAGRWFLLAAKWSPDQARQGCLKASVSIDGKEIAAKSLQGKGDLVGNNLYLGVPSNGGQPWVGLMEGLTISKR